MQRAPVWNMNQIIYPNFTINIILRDAIYDKLMPEMLPPVSSCHPRIGETNDLDLAHLDLSDMELLAALCELGDPLGAPSCWDY